MLSLPDTMTEGKIELITFNLTKLLLQCHDHTFKEKKKHLFSIYYWIKMIWSRMMYGLSDDFQTLLMIKREKKTHLHTSRDQTMSLEE